MQHKARQLPAYLLLLVPLVVLAWLGSAELSRLEERAERSVRDQARRFIDEAHREIERDVAGRSKLLLAQLPDLRQRLVRVTEELVEGDPWVLDLVVVDREGALVFPATPPPLERGLPFHRRSTVEAINRAELLESLGDLQGARHALESVVESTPRGGRENPTLRAHFTLGGILRRLGELDAAVEQYWLASAEADWTATRPQPTLPDSTHRSVALLCELAIAELSRSDEGGHRRLLELMLDIAAGGHSGVPDAMLEEVLRRLFLGIPPTSPLHGEAVDALHTNEIRLAGRAFAAEYASLLEQTVRRRLPRAGVDRRLDVVYSAPSGVSLLALRPVSESERRESADYVPPGSWIGLRIDLGLALREVAAPFLAPAAREFRLLVSDPEGGPVLGDASALSDLPDELRGTRPSVAGLRLEAVPVDSERYLEERRRTIRDRAILVLALCLAAGGGAFFLMRSAARESELAALKVELVSRVSHELKTPLSLIKMYAETLQMGRTDSPEQSARFLGIISREADQLTRTIERVLDFSKQESRRFDYDKKATDLGALLAHVADDYRQHAKTHDIRLVSELAENVEAVVDPDALENAVLNLLDNAVKYTNDSSDAERVVELRLGNDGRDALIEVLDRGIGVPDGQHRRVFDSFFRATNAKRRRGAGLGLSLVRHFAEAHGGRVVALPRDGGGSIFRITLPREDLHATTEHPDR